MDSFQFIASLVGSLAWPTVVLVVLFVIKTNIASIFPFIERLKYKDFELEFRKSVREMSERSRSAFPGQDADDQVGAPKDRLYALAEVSAPSAIFEAWLQVESASIQALQAKDQSLPAKTLRMAPLRLGQRLNRLEIINGAQLEIFNRLRELRNKAIHVPDAVFKPDEVAEYIALATSLASQISRGTYGP